MEYQELLKIVDEIEGNSRTIEFNAIDISDVSSSQMRYQRLSFGQLMKLAMQLEAINAEAIEEKRASKKAEREKQIIQPIIEAQPVQAAQQIISTAALKGIIKRARQEEQVSGEIGKFAEKLAVEPVEEPKPKATFRAKTANPNELVLPKLSIYDQVSELERIIEGLGENAFDKEHIEIIKKEVYGLNDELNRQKRDTKRLSSMELSIIELRNSRLSYVMAMLRDIGV